MRAVEIGYTRPEKLTTYRQKLKIPDVRWYDKQGKLHADVTEKLIKVSLELTPSSTMFVYHVLGQVECVDEACCDVCAGHEDHDEGCEDCHTYRKLDVVTTVVTDYVKAFFPSFCDKCGSHWLADEYGPIFSSQT